MTRDAHPRLVRLLRARAGAGARLVASAAAGWCSLTYAGQRHRLVFALPAGAADPFARLAAEELAVPGHLLVELAAVARRADGATAIVELAATTVELG